MVNHEIFGVKLDDIDPVELQSVLEAWLFGSEPKTIVTPNPEMVLLAKKDETFRSVLNRGDRSLPDGVGLRFAVAALSDTQHLRYRHTGVDTLSLLAELCARNHQRLILFGGKPGSAEKATEALKRTHATLDVVGMDPGRVDLSGDQSHLSSETIVMLQEARPVVLAVALGQGKQERFIEAVRDKIPSLRIAIGVGGAFETIASILPRAPEWMRRSGFEWLWRLLLEPRMRIGRIFTAIIIFPAEVVFATLKRRRFTLALRRVFPQVWQQIRGL